jgi:hypothetical protein
LAEEKPAEAVSEAVEISAEPVAEKLPAERKTRKTRAARGTRSGARKTPSKRKAKEPAGE